MAAMTPQEEVAALRKSLGYLTFDKQPTEWLDTKSSKLNAVLGSPSKGMPYGKMCELFGPESNGKTLLALYLAGRAQHDGARVAWVDYENSFDPVWAKRQGLNPDDLALISPQLVTRSKAKDKAKELILETAQETSAVVEAWMQLQAKNGYKKLFIVTDSVTAMLVEEEAKAGLTEQNMRTGVSQAAFLSKLLKRWIGYAANYGATMVFINQLRTAPGVMFGNPERTPGGKALKFYCSIRVKVTRAKSGRVTHRGKIVGLRAIATNHKNKTGEGSTEQESCGFEVNFDLRKWKFMTAQEAKDAEKEG